MCTFDRALCALPVTQHDRIWELYLRFVRQDGISVETSFRLYRRYLKYDLSHTEDFIEFMVNSRLWQEAVEMLAIVLNDDHFYSIKGKTKYTLWLELCDLLTRHAKEVSRLNVDAIIRVGIRKFTYEVGRLWTSLADCYIRRGLLEKARDVFEEGMATVVTVRDFSVIFDAYLQFEESVVAHKMDLSDVEEDMPEENGADHCEDFRLEMNSEFEKKILSKFWLHKDNDVELLFARLENLMDRRPELANSVLLRQNPHNVEQWHRRAKLFDGNPTKKVLTYTEAVRTVDPMKAVGKTHTLWIAFAKLYEDHNDLVNARVISDKAVQVNHKTVDDLASIWCEWAEMELRHENFEGALEFLRRATAEPSAEVKRRVAADGSEPVQMKVHRSLRLWTLYVKLKEENGNLESTRAVYEQILDLRIAMPQIIINYAAFLEKHKYFEDAFKVYERGVKIFKYPHVKDIWVTYLSKFVQRYRKTKLERARELFEHAIAMTPADLVKPLFLQYAKMEEDYGLEKRAMKVYNQGTKAVPSNEKLEMYKIYITRTAEIFGVPKTREIYEQAIEVQHGNEGTFRGMLRIKRSVSESYIPKDQRLSINEAKDKLKLSGVPEYEMGALEGQLAPVANNTNAKDGVSANIDDTDISEESDSEDDEKVGIIQRDVPFAVFEKLARKREVNVAENVNAGKDEDGESHFGALERIKRRKRA